MGYQLETTALISIDNYKAFRIRCIMLILDFLNAIEPTLLIKLIHAELHPIKFLVQFIAF